MNENNVKEHTQELLEVLIHSAGESDRGIIIVIAAHIEDCLQRIIESFLIDSKEVKQLFTGTYAPFGSLSGKTKAAYLMGLITKKELSCINAVRKVRNIFAHHIDADFEHEEVAKLCRKEPIYDGRLCDRDAFLHMAQNAVLPLLYRDLKNKRRCEELII